MSLRERRKKENNPFHGILLVNKESGMTSHDVVDKVRKILNQKAVGHAGTLDPMAEGLLVILLGQATKLSSYLLNRDKSYSLAVKCGLETDTLDKDGKVTKETAVSLEEEFIKQIVKSCIGVVQLPVPYFSAKKINGRKLYSYARAGEQVEIPKKEMSFYDLEIKEIKKDEISLSLSCTKGSYIRSWVHCVGQKLKVGACLIQLTRVASHPFFVSSSLTLSQIEEKLEQSPQSTEDLKTALGEAFVYTSSALPDFPLVQLTKRDLQSLSFGKIPPYLIQCTQQQQVEVNKTGKFQMVQAIKGNHLLALLELRPFQKMKIIRNFPVVQ